MQPESDDEKEVEEGEDEVDDEQVAVGDGNIVEDLMDFGVDADIGLEKFCCSAVGSAFGNGSKVEESDFQSGKLSRAND